MKCALLSYHKNLLELYPKSWIEQYKQSIINQTYKHFDIWEINYGGGEELIFEENSNFASMQFPTFVHVLSFALDSLFQMGYDCVANTNCDDYYSYNRLEKQIPYMEQGYDICSSNFSLIIDDKVTHTHKFHNLDIKSELRRGHNPICHPAVCYSKEFWKNNRYVPEQIPFEDMLLWQRAINRGSRFIILEDVLCYHRLHSNSVCQSLNR